MQIPIQPIAPETEDLLQNLGGPLSVSGTRGDYVLMRSDIYFAMLGLSDSDEEETIASVRRGLADMEAGRTEDLETVFDELDTDDDV
jgi:hypothetical protein